MYDFKVQQVGLRRISYNGEGEEEVVGEVTFIYIGIYRKNRYQATFGTLTIESAKLKLLINYK